MNLIFKNSLTLKKMKNLYPHLMLKNVMCYCMKASFWGLLGLILRNYLIF